jgi:hypothetical protein
MYASRKEIAMANPEDRMQPEGGPPDGRPRRPPPIIEGEAIEISPDGSRASAADQQRPAGASGPLGRMWAALPSRKIVAAVAAGLAAVIVAGASWIYLGADRAPPQHAAIPRPAPSGEAAGRAAGAGAADTVASPAAPAGPDRAVDIRTVADTRELENRLDARLAAVDAALAALNGRVAELDRIVRDAAASARAASERADKAIHQFDAAKTSGDEHEAAQQLDRSALDDLSSRIKTLESRQMTIRQIQERLDRLASATGAPDKAVRVALAAAALRNAVERDRPFTAEFAAARALGLDEAALAVLVPYAETGLPKRNDLSRELSELLPELRRVSAPPGQDLGYLDRLQASAARMLNIRPVKDEPGDEPATVLSRIEFKMVHQDVEGVVPELDKLPAPAKQAAQSWRSRALARRDAVEAARGLAIASLAKLTEPTTSGSSSQ